ncbi:MAG TPA: phospholipase D-like domain-containing protein, partial [Verrucomicrobiae bacterium]|nr:phospholipase D-like domain-containing protein [Verrucomicrobiae bacterium]
MFVVVTALLSAMGCSSLKDEKRVRHSITAHYAVAEPQFSNSISHLLGPPLVQGNRIDELINGDQIFPSMLEAIRSARKTITLETFIWKSGEVTRQFTDALCERARAGVKVHILVDAMGSSKLRRREIRELRDAGAEYVKFNFPLPFRMLRINHRTHRKIMVVDGKIGFTGGVCLADAWQGNGEPDRWRDTHFRIEGPVVSQMQAAFMDNWLQARSQVLHGDDYFPQLQPIGPITAQYFKSGPRDGDENAFVSYLLAIAAARTNIRLAHAQFVPNDLLLKALLDAHKRGVKIEVIVPSKLDNFAVKMAARSRYGKLLAGGIELYEFQPSLIHCKIMIVDDLWVTAGSVNFDERSFRINGEANMNVLNRDFAATLIRSFERDKSKSRQFTMEDYKKHNWIRKAFDQVMGFFRAQL